MRKNGFTLVELMVVIAIIAILAIGSITSYGAYINKANTSRYITEMSDIQRQIGLCIEGVNAESCQFSSQTCSALGWSFDAARIDNSITVLANCGESDNGFPNNGQGQTSTCHENVDWETARIICEDQGARLCTKNEILSGITAGSGCNHDNRLIWSMTPCQGGFYVALGHTGAIGNPSTTIEACQKDIYETSGNYIYDTDIAPPTDVNRFGVRCCAD